MLSPIAAKDVAKSNYILLKEKTCKIVEVHHSKTGKHGSMKVSLVGLNVFTQDKVTYACPGHHMLYQVTPQKKIYQIVDLIHLDNEDQGELLVFADDNSILTFKMPQQVPKTVWLKTLELIQAHPDTDCFLTVIKAMEGQDTEVEGVPSDAVPTLAK
jgi:translation elongation factor P/translation initiation factor 5A